MRTAIVTGAILAATAASAIAAPAFAQDYRYGDRGSYAYDQRYQSPCHDSKQSGAAVGTVLGAIAGGLIGSNVAGRGDRTAGTVVGAVAGASGAAFSANRPASIRQTLARGLYGLSNGGLDEPWPKTVRLKAAVGDWLERGETDLEPLFKALRDETLPPDDALPSTGLSRERERLAAAVFIRNPLYGTRCSTVVRIGADGAGRIAERSFSPAGDGTGEAVFDFAWPQIPPGS